MLRAYLLQTKQFCATSLRLHDSAGSTSKASNHGAFLAQQQLWQPGFRHASTQPSVQQQRLSVSSQEDLAMPILHWGQNSMAEC